MKHTGQKVALGTLSSVNIQSQYPASTQLLPWIPKHTFILILFFSILHCCNILIQGVLFLAKQETEITVKYLKVKPLQSLQ